MVYGFRLLTHVSLRNWVNASATENRKLKTVY
jgi:hypothetical protein